MGKKPDRLKRFVFYGSVGILAGLAFLVACGLVAAFPLD